MKLHSAITTPAPKKRKISQPIVFTAPGLGPDVSLKVFDNWEFHVHSVLLKLHSAFFRKFLDSADKNTAGSTTDAVPASGLLTTEGAGIVNGAAIRYEWVTQIDEDGDGWHLVEKSKALAERQDMGTFKGDLYREEHTFHSILCAIYVEQYYIHSFEELERLVTMADYYCTLRIVSLTLNGPLLHRSMPSEDLRDNACRATELAVKLRHKYLFEDCLTLSAGPWNAPSYESDGFKDDEARLYLLALHTRGSIANMIDAVQQQLLLAATYEKEAAPTEIQNAKGFGEELMNIAQQARLCGTTGLLQLPLYYRLLSKSDIIMTRLSESWQLSCLLGNDRELIPGAKSGKGIFGDHFLCRTYDHDYPWDSNETDW